MAMNQQSGAEAKAILKAAIIGCGGIAGACDEPANPHITTHARALADHPGFRLEACCDSDPIQARAFADKWRCPQVFSEVEDLFVRAPADLYVVAASTGAHAGLLERLLRLPGRPAVLCEKPLVASPAEWRALAHALRKPPGRWLANYPRRFDVAHGRLAALIRGGSLGELLSFHGNCAKGFLHNGCHLVDLVFFLAGPIANLKPVALRRMGEGDTAGTLACRLESGVEGTLDCVGNPAYSLFELEMVFSRGKVEIKKIGYELSVFTARPSTVHPGFSDLERSQALDPTYDRAFAGAYGALADPGFDAEAAWEAAWRGTGLLMDLTESA